VYVGRTNESVAPNRNEIAATRFLRADELRRALATEPDRFTPWFKLEWLRLEHDYGDLLDKYLSPL
jgi:isopentenyl-diphosphate delta-isomerase